MLYYELIISCKNLILHLPHDFYMDVPSQDEMSHHHVLEECCKTLDLSFNFPYLRGRAVGIIGPLQLAIVKEGTFARLMNQFVQDRGVGASQYKTPRCIVNPATLKILREDTIATFRSSDSVPPELLAAWRPSTSVMA